MVQNQQALVDSYKRQVDALPASMGSGHSRQPKIGEPLAFKGSEDKTKLEEWLDLIYMKSYYVKMWEGKDLGTWKAFVAELAQIYGDTTYETLTPNLVRVNTRNAFGKRLRTMGKLRGGFDTSSKLLGGFDTSSKLLGGCGWLAETIEARQSSSMYRRRKGHDSIGWT
ncbi:predicted protein [Postia placenta Mad-698-R]|nr:predicted protein [Postia placenta Mad-698-R]